MSDNDVYYDEKAQTLKNMRTDEVVITIGGILAIAFIYWFFLGKRGKAIEVQEEIDIIVDGGYSPEIVSIPHGKTTRLNFTRRDKNSCLEEIVLSDFKVKRYLPLNEKVTIEITPKREGEFNFSCGMGMFHGKIIVRR